MSRCCHLIAKARCVLYRLIGSVHTLEGLPGAIADFLREMDSVRRAVAVQAGLSAGELRVMSRIAEADGVTPKQVSTDLELTTGAITSITNGLVAKGLIVRVEQPHDRRSLLLQLTDEGHRIMEAAYTYFQNTLATAADSLGKKRRDELVEALGAITAGFKASK